MLVRGNKTSTALKFRLIICTFAMFTNVDTQRFGTNANAHIHKVANHLEDDNCANNSKGNGYDKRNQLRN